MKVEKWKSWIFEKKLLIWRYPQKRLQISIKSGTLTFFSKPTLTSFLFFGLKLVLNMTFNLNETLFFLEKFAILRYLTTKSSKFGCFLTIHWFSQCILASTRNLFAKAITCTISVLKPFKSIQVAKQNYVNKIARKLSEILAVSATGHSWKHRQTERKFPAFILCFVVINILLT